ncbi:hypothetical protein ANCDUO_09542 [Ancylostoma duodenale]|uniref:Integrase catalytic domain-containing protein n=1 Tax=Ancylostoma duodenale TaxID=51022 RepID=A0A0C2GMH5_9BILA|nr:hypothetical protein ANCDUO_09542 [Ancylostoma duodenale]
MCEERGATHVRTPLYHPQSNDQAERFVDILKRGIKKLKGERSPTLRPSTDCRDTVLLAYRTTSNAALQGKSPAEVFLGRRLGTRLGMLVPRREQPEPDFAADRRKQIEAQFNRKHGTRSREFSSGDTVMVKSHRGASKFEWTEGTAYKLLVISPAISRSHRISNERIADKIAMAGHDVHFLEQHSRSPHYTKSRKAFLNTRQHTMNCVKV